MNRHSKKRPIKVLYIKFSLFWFNFEIILNKVTLLGAYAPAFRIGLERYFALRLTALQSHRRL